MRRRSILVTGAMALAIASASPAAAQGNGRGNAFGLFKTSGASGPSASSAPEVHVDGTGTRTFGSWLDDASIMPEGSAFATFGFGYWKTPEYREFDVPTMDAGLALHRRVQVGMSLPFYHASLPGGPVARGLGDLYLTGKVQLREPGNGRLGFALTPIVELLTVAPTPEASRVSWGLPINLESQHDGWRVFGSTGYFSRGALFASGAVEMALSERLWLTGSLSHSYSMKRDDLSVELGLSKARTDVSASTAIAVLPNMALFASIGRTISARDANSAVVQFAAGASLSFKAWSPTTR